jgi:phytoene desaturase
MPALLERTFHAAGSEMADLIDLRPVSPIYRAQFADGSVISVRPGADAMAEEVRAVCGPGEAAAFRRFASWLGRLYEVEMRSFIDRNYRSALDLCWPPADAVRLLGLGALRHLEPKVRSFFRDERLVRLFSFQSLYAGLAPAEALAVFNIITYMDSIAGVYFPVGGISAVAKALAVAATKAGATFYYSSPAARIELAAGSTGPVRSVLLESGERIPADAVVCNADLPDAYHRLLPGLAPPGRAIRGRYAPSALVWHVGARGRLPADIAHHNLFFGRDWDGAFRALVHEGRRMPDPSLLVTVPTVDDPGLAPEGAHALYVLEPVPNLAGRVDWTTERAIARDALARRVAALGFPATVEVEELVDPTDWQREGLQLGTPFGLAHSFGQSGPFRPPNVDRRAPGLVFAGANTVPGVGVPMVLVSGRLAAERVDRMGTGDRAV